MRRSGTRPHYRVTFAVLITAVGAYALLQSLVAPVLPTIQHELNTDQNTVTWVMTAYLLSASVCTPILGRIGDMVGKERMLLVTLAALAVGALIGAVAPNIGVLILARAIQGAGGALMPLAFGIIRDEFPAEKVAGAVGTTAAIVAVGAGLGTVLAGPIVDGVGYRWLFWIPMIAVVLCAVAAWLLVPESPVRTPGKVSLGSAALLSAWLVALLIGVSEGGSWGWLSARVLGLFAVAAVLIAIWIRVELLVTEPLIDMRMMRLPAVWTNNLVALLFGAGMYTTMAFLPQFLQTPTSTGYGFGASITRSGIYLLPSTVAMFVAGLASGRLADWFGSKAVLVVGGFASAVPYAMFAFAHDTGWEIYVASTVMGFAMGGAFSAMAALIVQAVPPTQTGVASGMNANIRTIGGSIGAALMSTLVTSQLAADGLPEESGYTTGFALLAGLTVLAAIASVFIPSGREGATPVRLFGRRGRVVENPELAMVAGGTLVEDVRAGDPESA